MTAPRVPAPLIDAALVCAALADTWANVAPDNRVGLACALPAAVALLLRRHLPVAALALTLSAALVTDAVLAPLIALYALAATTRSRPLILAGAAAFTACYMLPWPPPAIDRMDHTTALIDFAYSLAMAAAPAFLGQLVQARRDLSLRLAEITEAREHERLLIAQTVLAKERAQLAREMHDVVSHQVSLIAVRAGALQVGTHDPETKEAATTIRRLCVRTLDELRHMVSVLRASGSLPTDLTPQPTIAELRQLVDYSGIETELDLDLPDDLPPPLQRAVYRTVQEALTNVRKHAPGATAAVRVQHAGGAVLTTVTNTAPTRPTLALPSARHGLIGLRQRAELLGGTLTTGPTPEGGYRLQLRLPVD
ncbi:histidine kinase [Streptomyces sp. B1866]|uniref:sensor histidine kinase n=1 Tax=Streptomyces sp. B1866 TaxID=3075431 RepID=UPI00288CE092|nr:histidine kinase [Streptomyces sp. B1866]MDT3398916.1 histidine kinase [Streptomyces sp. B1866]